MGDNIKYCKQCGEQLENQAKFCTNCGYSIETKQAPAQSAVTKEESSRFKDRFNKKGILAIAVIILLGFVVYFIFGGIDIAGKYTNGSETMEIKRNGKLIATAVEEGDFETIEITGYLNYDDFNEAYTFDLSKDIDFEISIPTEEIYSDGSLDNEVALAMEMFGFEQNTSGNMTIISGELAPAQAEMLGLEVTDFFIEEDPDGIYVDDEFYSKF